MTKQYFKKESLLFNSLVKGLCILVTNGAMCICTTALENNILLLKFLKDAK